MKHEDFLFLLNNLEFLSYSKYCVERCESVWFIMFVFLLHQINNNRNNKKQSNYLSIQNSNYWSLSFSSPKFVKTSQFGWEMTKGISGYNF